MFRFRLAEDERVRVGRLGEFVFPDGWYIYAGSALGGLAARLRRHLHGPSSGKLHWHIDYLAPLGRDKAFRTAAAGSVSECALNTLVAGLPGAFAPAPGFGSSDCRCGSHLHRLCAPLWPESPELRDWRQDEAQSNGIEEK